ncbi:hypothetical protein D3Z38_19815, partial [Clostridiales bacterium]|nr:hypothetical protein [Clostridiales bacterium]
RNGVLGSERKMGSERGILGPARFPVAKWAQRGILGQPRVQNGLRKGDLGSVTHPQRKMGSERGILGQPRVQNGLRKGDLGSAMRRQREAGSEMDVLGSACNETGAENIILGALFWELPQHRMGSESGFLGPVQKKQQRKRTQKAAFGVRFTSPAHTELRKRGLGPA